MNIDESDLKEIFKNNPSLAKMNPDIMPKAKKKSKYHNKKIYVDGICFDSVLESKYYSSLKLLQRAGEIKGFCRQPQFILTNGNEVITYRADFIVFYENRTEIVDTKGILTDAYKMKKKLFKNQFPDLEIVEVREV